MTTDEQLSQLWRSSRWLVGDERIHNLFVEARKHSTAECYSAKMENTPADLEYQKVFGKKTGGTTDGGANGNQLNP